MGKNRRLFTKMVIYRLKTNIKIIGRLMCIVTDLNNLENSLMAEFKELAAWKQLQKLKKQDMDNLLLQNYGYSKRFPELVELAYNNAKESNTKNVFERLIKQENDPDSHEKINRNNLLHLGFKSTSFDDVTLLDCTQKLIKLSKEYSCTQKYYSDLACLCYYRLGAELLAGIWYENLVPIIRNIYNPEPDYISFFIIHAERDKKTVDISGRIENMNDANHADIFSRPIFDLLMRDGKSAYSVAELAYQDAFRIKKSYIEGLIETNL